MAGLALKWVSILCLDVVIKESIEGDMFRIQGGELKLQNSSTLGKLVLSLVIHGQYKYEDIHK